MNNDEDPLSTKALSTKERIKVAIFGAGGAVGSILAGFLQKMDSVAQITCLDLNLKRMYEFLASRDKIFHLFADLNGNGEKEIDEKILRALKDHFLIINAASPKFNLKIMKAAIKVRAHYLDFASLDDIEAEQKKTQKGFKKTDRTAWINMGVGPGLTNLLAATLINGLTDCVVRIRVAESTRLKLDANGKRPLIFLWNPELALNEAMSKIYDGDIVREPFSGVEFCIFPYPIGKIPCRNLNENEAATLRKSYPRQILRVVDVKSGGEDVEQLRKDLPKIKKLHTQNRLDSYAKELKTTLPDEIKAMLKDGTIIDGRVAIVVECEGEQTGERITKRASWMGLSIREVPSGTTHICYNTAIVAFAAFKQMITAEKLVPGVWAPEEILADDRAAILNNVQTLTNLVLYQTF